MDQLQQPETPKTVGGGRYEVTAQLGSGSFGDVYSGLDVLAHVPVAIKFEDGKTNQLENELSVLQKLQGRGEKGLQGFARILYYGRKRGRFCLVMECLGQSLDQRLKSCGGTFTVQTTVLVAQQMLYCVEVLHSRGVVHRDIKPGNFMFGVADRSHHVYLIDFGLADEYWTAERAHIQIKRESEFKGTMRYCSANAQRYLTQSRRDDLEAVGNMWVYFLRGSLPWMGLQATSQAEAFNLVRDAKESSIASELCEGLPAAFEHCLEYVQCLGFTERPDYGQLQRSMAGLRKELEGQSSTGRMEDHDFEWESGVNVGECVPLYIGREVARQPDDEPLRPCPVCEGQGLQAEGCRNAGDDGRLSCNMCGSTFTAVALEASFRARDQADAHRAAEAQAMVATARGQPRGFRKLLCGGGCGATDPRHLHATSTTCALARAGA